MTLLHGSRIEGDFSHHTVPVGRQVVEFHALRDVTIPQPVDERLCRSGQAVNNGYRVGQEVTIEHEMISNGLAQSSEGLWTQFCLSHSPTPCDVSSVFQGRAGKQKPAPGGADAVCAHQQVATLAATAGEADVDTCVVLIKTDDRLAEVVVSRIETVQQALVECVVGTETVSVLFFVCDAAVPIHITHAVRRDTDLADVEDAVPGEVAYS